MKEFLNLEDETKSEQIVKFLKTESKKKNISEEDFRRRVNTLHCQNTRLTRTCLNVVEKVLAVETNKNGLTSGIYFNVMLNVGVSLLTECIKVKFIPVKQVEKMLNKPLK